ncbi:MAG: amidase [Gemmatimonadaceae bacterium]
MSTATATRSILDRDTLNAFTRHTHVALDGASSGPLAGLTFGLKDIYDVAGYRTGFGSPDWLATHEPATRNAPVLQMLLDAGANLVGKTHTEEMAFSLTGENAHYGTPINVAAPGRVPGGSSSGSAAAVAADLVDFAIGSDTGGSVRGPASFCGIYGIRPTHGRITLEGACPLAPIFDTCGWFASNAAILELVGSVLFENGANPLSQKAGQLLIAQDAFAYAMPGVTEALEHGVQRVRARLGNAQSVTVCDEGVNVWYNVFRTLQYEDIWNSHGAWIMRVNPTFGQQMKARFELIKANDRSTLPGMREARVDIQRRLDTLLANNAVLLLPSISDVAPVRGASPADTVAFRERALGLLCIAGLGGLPQLSLPFGTLNGLPIGLSMIAARGNDELLLSLATELGERLRIIAAPVSLTPPPTAWTPHEWPTVSYSRIPATIR